MKREIKEMDIIAIIPARGGSERIPKKNITPLAGKPLIVYSIERALSSKYITDCFVSTDNTEIAKTSRDYGAKVIDRPKEFSSSTSQSEEALIHTLKVLKKEGRAPDLIVFLQCTSPLREKNDIDNAIKQLVINGADSLFSACREYGLFWAKEKDKFIPINYDSKKRIREQDMKIQYRENGSIYILKPEVLIKHKNRLGGKISLYEMREWNSFQIDRPSDLKLLEFIIKNK